MEIRKHPMHLMPAMKLVKQFAETGSLGRDAVTVSDQEMSLDMEPVMKGARLHRQAAALLQLDGKPQDLEEAANQVHTSDGQQAEASENALYMCIPKGDSTTYFVVQTEGDIQRLAHAEQSNLEMGGPPTQFYGIEVNTKTRQYSAQRLTWEH